MENRDDQTKNQAGQQGQQGQSSTGQTGSDQGAFGKSGDDTTLAQGQKNLADKQREEEEAATDKGIVGTSKEKDTSESLVETDFAETGQGATEARTGTGATTNEDIESGTTPTRDAALDDGS